MKITQSRRRFVTNAAAAGAAGFGALGGIGRGGGGRSLAAEPPPEITTIRFEKDPITCIAPQTAEELMRAEAFSDIRYVYVTEAHIRRGEAANSSADSDMIAHGEVDFARDFAPSLILGMNAGAPITVLAGLHLGCFEIFGKEEIRALADLKGRTVGISYATDEVLLKIMVGLIGLDPTTDIRWVTSQSIQPMELFIEGTIDAFLAVPPLPPVATKRLLRAILKGADLCVSQPARVAQLLVDNGYAARYDYALQALREIRYDVWRDYDPEDTLRFYALRMHEAGMIKSSPQKLIAEHTDWRFLNELERELKV